MDMISDWCFLCMMDESHELPHRIIAPTGPYLRNKREWYFDVILPEIGKKNVSDWEGLELWV